MVNLFAFFGKLLYCSPVGWEMSQLLKYLLCKHEGTFGSPAPIEAKYSGDVYNPRSEEANKQTKNKKAKQREKVGAGDMAWQLKVLVVALSEVWVQFQNQGI